MTQELLIKYYTELEYILSIEDDLKELHEDDLYFVLETLLPEGTDIDVAVKELTLKWKN
jgi:hypothetical protein